MENVPASGEAEATLSSERISDLRRELLTAVRRACPAWLLDHAEDIVQTTLIRLVDVQKKTGGNTPLHSSYLSRVAYNAMVDEVRLHFRRRETRADQPPDMERAPARTVHPEQRAIAAEIHRGIRDCLGRMIRSRRITVACHLLGYSVPETARFLGWTAKKAEHLTRRGLADLRACLSAKGLTP